MPERHSQTPSPGQSWDLFQDQLDGSVAIPDEVPAKTVPADNAPAGNFPVDKAPVDQSLAEDLAEDYYLQNFVYLITFVADRYESILNLEELGLIRRFHDLILDAQKLYVRLWMRKGPLFRSDKLSYPEIGCIEEAAIQLRNASFLIDAVDTALEDVLKLLTRDEMIALLQHRAGIKTLRRPQLEMLLLSSAEEGCFQSVLPFEILRPQGHNVLKTLRLLFFGNLHQDMSEFVLRDLGVSPFETYQIDHNNQTFSHRGVVDEALHLYELGELADAVIAEKDPLLLVEFARGFPPRNCDVASLGRRHDRLVNRIARQMERQDLDDSALHYYRKSFSTPARERTARILARGEERDAVVAMCEQIVADPWEESEFEFAVKFMKRQLPVDNARRAQLPDLALAVSTIDIDLPRQPDVRVEQRVLAWAEREGATARYVENALFPGLFGLAFWDIIFADIPSVFFNPFQRGPADLFHQNFHRARSAAIEQRFLLLQQPDQLRQLILRHYASKQGLNNYFVSWTTLTRELVDLALEAIRPDHLLAIFRRLLVDLRNNRSGFPDLIVFHEGGYQLIEVKGPGDRLQLNQQRWFRFFNQVHMPAIVANVTFQDYPVQQNPA